MILKVAAPQLETLAQTKTLIHQTCAEKSGDALTGNGDEASREQWGKRVIKQKCKSTDNCSSKCINVSRMLAKGCLICGKLPSSQAGATLKQMKSRVGKLLGARPTPEEPDLQQRLSLHPRVLISFLLFSLFFSSLSLSLSLTFEAQKVVSLSIYLLCFVVHCNFCQINMHSNPTA